MRALAVMRRLGRSRACFGGGAPVWVHVHQGYLVGLWGWGGKVRVNSLGVFFENVRFVVASPKILDYRSPA